MPKEKIRTVEAEPVEELGEDAPATERLEACIDEAVEFMKEELMPALERNAKAVEGNTQALGMLLEKLGAIPGIPGLLRIFKKD